jgi:amino acid adenylation domain-containing protein
METILYGSDLLKLSEENVGQKGYHFETHKKSLPSDKTVLDLIIHNVDSAPNHIAVESEGESITYSQLMTQGQNWGNFFLSKGIIKGDCVGLLIDRSLTWIAVVIGCMIRGIVFVPLDPKWPNKWIERSCRDLSLKLLVVNQSDSLERISFLETCLELVLTSESLDAKHHLDTLLSSDDPAYMMYTSGSSGDPTGILIGHESLMNVVDWVNTTYEVDSNDRLLWVSSVGFDLSIYDVFGILSAGGTICLPKESDRSNPEILGRLLHDLRITFWDSTPLLFQQVLEVVHSSDLNTKQASLRLVFLSGDWISIRLPEKCKSVFPKTRFIALGGATEATIWSNYFEVDEVDPAWQSIPYGQPIQNAEYFVLDDELSPCNIGTPGNLYIGGECLALSCGQEEDTSANRLIPSPFAKGERLFDTGDRVKLFDSGIMEFLGRQSSQEKIRGYRVDLKMIEKSLLEYPTFNAVVVLKYELQESDALIAWYVSNESVDSETLRSFVAEKLPKYCVPVLFYKIDQLPLTPSGKLDKEQLFSLIDKNEQTEVRLAKGPMKELMQEVWSTVFGIQVINPGSDFFELGGDSLIAIRIITELERKGIDCNMADIFYYRTVEELSEYLISKGTSPKSV